MRGFRGKFQDLDAYAGITSRSGQRLVNVVAAVGPDFILFGLDASQAFAKGLTFAELSALRGMELREVQFDVPNADSECFRQVQGS